MSVTVDQKTGFEVYLEGIKVPFSSISISERENARPSAGIQFPAPSGATQILPGTIVQIFGPAASDPSSADQRVLLFEGQVSGLSYSKGSQGRVAALQCEHILSEFDKATVRPKTSLVTSQRRVAEGTPVGGKEYVFLDNSSLKGPITNQNYKELLEQSLDIFQTDRVTRQLLEEIDVAGYGPFIISFTQLLAEENSEGSKLISEGELYYFIEFFLRYFEKLDPYYGTISRGFKIPESIFTWPNANRMYPFKTKMILTKSLKILSSLNAQKGNVSNAKLIDAINTFMQTVDYSMSVPAAPTYGQLFWKTKNTKGPNRANFMPNLENSPPALCNTFFPSQVSSFNYERPMGQEATRVVGTFSVPLDNNQLAERGFTSITSAPRLEIDSESGQANRAALTQEESYRGINLKTPVFNYYMSEAFLKTVSEQTESGNPSINIPDDAFHFGKQINIKGLQGFGDSLQQLTFDRYLKWRYGSRMVTMEAEWSPFRMTGLPGLVVENNGPSIMGVVTAIETNIDANGSATSSISFRSPRLIHDETNEFLQAEGSDSENFKHAINSFTNDGIQDTNYFLFDPELYNFTNIGADLYNYLVYGSGSKHGNKLNSDGTKIGFKNFKDRIDNLEKSPVKDASILNYLKDKNGDIQSQYVNQQDPAEVRYSKFIIEATKKLKQVYKEISETEPTTTLKQRMDQINFRRLTSKQQYFNFLDVPLNSDFSRAQPEAYKDSEIVFKGLANLQALEKLIVETEGSATEAVNLFGREINELKAQIKKTEEEIEANSSYLERIGSGRISKSAFTSQQLTSAVEQARGKQIPKVEINITSAPSRSEASSTFINSESNLIKLLQKEYEDALANESSLDRKLKEKQETLKNLQEQLDQTTQAQQSTKTLESEAFKLYNLIRRAHVNLGFKDIQTQGDINVIKNN